MEEEKITSAIIEYNKTHNPESKASLIKKKRAEFTITFAGPLCRSCGAYDYFEDYALEYEKVAMRKLKIARVQEKEGIFIVNFEQVRPWKSRKTF